MYFQDGKISLHVEENSSQGFNTELWSLQIFPQIFGEKILLEVVFLASVKEFKSRKVYCR